MRKTLSCLLVAGLTGACGGGGGSDSSGPESFTSFSNAPQDGTVRINGRAKSASYTYDLGTTETLVSEISSDNAAYVDVTYENGEVVRVNIGNTNANLDLNSASGAVFTDEGIIIVGGSANGEDFLIASNGFNYQTFGLWLTGYDTGGGTVGAGSFGAATSSTDMPTSGSAVFLGESAGFVTDGTGYAATVADVEVSADFGTPSVTVEVFNTELVDIETGERSLGGRLNFNASGQISGSSFILSAGGDLTSGTIEGQFYGPSAEEVGGTFLNSGFSDSGGEITHVGSFGAAR